MPLIIGISPKQIGNRMPILAVICMGESQRRDSSIGYRSDAHGLAQAVSVVCGVRSPAVSIA